ncbi:MAG: DUF3108 domain-containing protein [Amylibacter sp.]|nr:DUF3108 domain-containing protein [Amylibacter sp.]
MKPIVQTLALITGLTLPVSAGAENITLKLYAYGIKAGTISINGAENATAYSVKGLVSPSILLRMFKDIGYKGWSSGKISKGKFYTRKYDGRARTGSRNSIVKMHWNNNRPVLDKYSPERAKRDYDISPSKQVGTKDLLTAAYLTFRTVTADNLCNVTHKMFDGRRRSQIQLGKPKISGRRATCAGSYKRVAGFSPHQMTKGVNFPFTMYYEQQDDGTYRFKEFISAATLGKIRAVRK